MSEHRSRIEWQRGDAVFEYETYSRNHTWHFENGLRVEASAAPDFLGDAARVDPEQALVASISSCHMLTFLALAAKRRLLVDRYTDEAVGFMEKNDAGRMAVTRVVLRPRIDFSGDPPSGEQLARLHELAHEQCFIANSVHSEVRVEAG